MRWRCFVAAMLVLCGAGQTLCAEFPYTAYVNSADVYVRSGPGRDYYPTDKLQKGEKVEVYRHDPGGWYAIRPPRQSFSWVSSRRLNPAEDGLAVVNVQGTVARVGSSFSDVRDVIQVRLDKGEKVALIEPPSAESPWCKVAPPAGEFRWVFSKYVDRDVPPDVAADEREASAGREPDVRLTSGTRELESAAEDAGTRKTNSFSRPKASSETALQRELDRIDLELSIMVAEDISAWSFGDLQRRSESVLNEAQTPIERGRARVTLDKLARFDDIKQRHEAVRRGPDEADGSSRPPPGSGNRRADDPRFDGVGRLSPVVSQKTGGPQYALVDSTNAVVSFVTPAPGVNLRPYVDKVVGVNGQRGYMTDLQRQHINVQRVTVLDLQRR
jgi:uncharacterized protein YraI